MYRRAIAALKPKVSHFSNPLKLAIYPGNSSLSSSTRTDSDDNSLLLFTLLHQNGSIPSPSNFSTLLSVCANSDSFSLGEQVHSFITKLGFESNLFIASALINLYSKCGTTFDAQRVFEQMPERNVVACNSLISAYSRTQYAILAFDVFFEMTELGISPNEYTFSGILVTCSRLEAKEMGIQIHSLIFKLGFYANVVVGTALIDLYANCSSLNELQKVFDEMPVRNMVTWTSIINGYAKHEKSVEAMTLFRDMRRLCVGLNSVTYNTVLSSFSTSKDLDNGEQVHGQVIREGMESHAYVVLTLMSMYSKCGRKEGFFKIFLTVPASDQITCNSIIAGLSNLGYDFQVLKQFLKMRRACIDMDFFTFTTVLRAVGVLSALEEGKQIHALVFKTGYSSHVFVQNGLVSMYSRCGSIESSKRVFLSMSAPDLVSWNSIVSGCAQHGFGMEAVDLFEQMRRMGIRPDHTTFISVLTACSHVGLLQKGLEYFDLMRNNHVGISPQMEHYACVVDLFGRSGHLEEAELFINSMTIKPGASVYRALLSACSVYGVVDIAKRAAKCLFEQCPRDPSTYVLLSNIFAQGGCWDDKAGVRKLMIERGVRKRSPGCSWIDVNDKDCISNLIDDQLCNGVTGF